MKTFLHPLTQQEESLCLKKMSEGDSEARRILIERNLRLVAHVCKKYQSKDEDFEDLISIGTIGLIKAVSTFQETKGSRLGTYAARCIDNELLMYFRGKKKTTREISLYEPIGTDKEGNQIQLLDIVESGEQDVFGAVELAENTRRLYQLIPAVLGEREQEIITLRYGLHNSHPLTQREVAQRMGISRSYVSRLEKRALEKIRQEFDGSY